MNLWNCVIRKGWKRRIGAAGVRAFGFPWVVHVHPISTRRTHSISLFPVNYSVHVQEFGPWGALENYFIFDFVVPRKLFGPRSGFRPLGCPRKLFDFRSTVKAFVVIRNCEMVSWKRIGTGSRSESCSFCKSRSGSAYCSLHVDFRIRPSWNWTRHDFGIDP